MQASMSQRAIHRVVCLECALGDAAKKAMDDSVVWLLVCPLLTNTELEKLNRIPPIWSSVSLFVQTSLFWSLRCENLTGRTLSPCQISISAWKKSYHLLELHRDKPNAFHLCCEDEHAIRVLLEIGRDPAAQPDLLSIVCEKGYSDIVSSLLSDNRIDPSRQDCICLIMAINNGRVEIVKLLLDDGRVDSKVDYCRSRLKGTVFPKSKKIYKLLKARHKLLERERKARHKQVRDKR